MVDRDVIDRAVDAGVRFAAEVHADLQGMDASPIKDRGNTYFPRWVRSAVTDHFVVSSEPRIILGFDYANIDRWRRFESYAALIAVFDEDDWLRSQIDSLIGVGGSSTRLELARAVVATGVEPFVRQDGLAEFDDHTARDSVRKLVNGYADTHLELVEAVPLIGFASDATHIELEPGLQIRPLTDDELSKCINHRLLGSASIWNRDMTLLPEHETWCLVRHRREPKTVGSASPPVATDLTLIADQAESVIIASRLVNTGALATGRPASWQVPHPLVSGEGVQYWNRPSAQHRAERVTRLGVADVEVLKRSWEEVTKVRSKGDVQLDIALSRFAGGSLRLSPEDELLDLMIAAEALLSNKNSELAFRISLHAASLIGADATEAKKIRAFMTKAYDVRSRIVHGDRVSRFPTLRAGGPSDLSSTVADLEGVIRRVILRIMEIWLDTGKRINWEEWVDRLLDKSTPPKEMPA